jgi:hypothetical protein
VRSEKVEDRFQRNLRFPWLVKDIGKDLQETLGPSAVDERIRAIEIAERLQKAIGPGLEHEPFVLLMPAHPHRQSQLEGHVEPRHAAAKLYPRKIMDGNRAAPQQVLNPFEPPLRARDLNHPAGPQPEPAQPGNGRQIEGRVPPIEGDVQKDFGSGSGLAQRAWLTRAGRCAALRAALRRGFTAVTRPLAAATEALYFSRNSFTSREILRWVAAESLKTRAVSARVGHLPVRRTRRRAMS